MEEFINKLKAKLQNDLPGQEAQFRMAPLHRDRVNPKSLSPEQYRPSAVMIVFCIDADESLFIPLIERMPYEGVHSAQISLPGGKFDKEDRDLEHTALRECYEEIGLNEIEIIGSLSQLFISVSGFLVQPVVGYCKIKSPDIKPAMREVKTMVKLPLSTLLDEAKIARGSIELGNRMRIETPWLDVDGHRVWGATAMILSELKELIKTIS